MDSPTKDPVAVARGHVAYRLGRFVSDDIQAVLPL